MGAADPLVIASGFGAAALYVWGITAYGRRRKRRWPWARTAFFLAGVASGVLSIESPLDAAADARFAPHMIQHLMLMSVAAPCMLLGAPMLLAMAATPTLVARRFVAVLRSRVVHAIAFPPVAWIIFVLSLWIVHFSALFEAALEHEPVHQLEHAILLGTALLFWSPVIAIGPTPWIDGPLSYPLRMFYVLVSMPAQAFLGFSIYGARHVLYAHYARAGLEDQQAAGEIMWIVSGLVMFVAFMILGYRWSQEDRRLGERYDRMAARLSR